MRGQLPASAQRMRGNARLLWASDWTKFPCDSRTYHVSDKPQRGLLPGWGKGVHSEWMRQSSGPAL